MTDKPDVERWVDAAVEAYAAHTEDTHRVALAAAKDAFLRAAAADDFAGGAQFAEQERVDELLALPENASAQRIHHLQHSLKFLANIAREYGYVNRKQEMNEQMIGRALRELGDLALGSPIRARNTP